MSSKNQVALIEVSIGALPEWYLEDEGNNDILLEEAVVKHWRSNREFSDAEINVIYNYQTDDAIVTAWNEDGDQLWQRDNHDFGYALDYAKRNNYVQQ